MEGDHGLGTGGGEELENVAAGLLIRRPKCIFFAERDVRDDFNAGDPGPMEFADIGEGGDAVARLDADGVEGLGDLPVDILRVLEDGGEVGLRTAGEAQAGKAKYGEDDGEHDARGDSEVGL